MNRGKKIGILSLAIVSLALLVSLFVPLIPLGPNVPSQLHDACSIASPPGKLTECVPPSRGLPPPRPGCTSPCDAFSEWYGSVAFTLSGFGGYLVIENGPASTDSFGEKILFEDRMTDVSPSHPISHLTLSVR